jgi:hypothetical protein
MATSPETPRSPAEEPRVRRARVTLALAVGVLGVGLAAHAAAVSGYERSFDTRSALSERASAAETAARLEPWSAQFRTRLSVLGGWLRGQQLLDAGKYDEAVSVLAEAYRLDVGNRELLALFVRAQDAQARETNRKAHLQHGHEGPGGTLTPQDLER